MSRNRKNFHYHYAEQYETREERLAKRKSKQRFVVPPVALIFSVVLLVVFGLISTTFSVYVTTSFDDPNMPEQGGLVVNVKNGAARADADLQSTGIVRNNDMDLAESGADTKIIFVELSASWAQSGSILVHYWGSGISDGDASLSAYSGSIYKASIPSGATGFKLHWNNGDWYGSDGDASSNNYAKLKQDNGVDYSTYQVTSTASLSASSTSILTSQSSTLTPSITNTTYNEIKSTSYSVTRNSGSGTGSVSEGVFTATGAGTYTITATVTYNPIGYTGITKTATATKQITVTAPSYCTMSVTGSKAVTLGTATAVSFTTSNHSTGSVKITSADSSYVQVSSSQNGTYGTTATISGVSSSGTFYVKGLKPTSSPINVIVSCNAGHSNAVSSTCAVKVNTPIVTFGSCTVEELRSETLTITARTPAPTSYSWSVDSAYSSLISLSDQTATSVKITAAAYSSATAKVKYTATYSTGYSKTFEADVTIEESALTMKGSFDSWTDHKLTYDATASATYGHGDLYSYTYTLSGNTTYEFGFENNGFYKYNGTVTSTTTACKVTDSSAAGWTFTTGANNCKITTGAAGSYTFYYNKSNNIFYISDYPGVEYYLEGLGNGWEANTTTQMTKTATNVYTFTKTCTAAESHTYNTNNGFKIYCNDGTWYSLNGTVTYTNYNNLDFSSGTNNTGFTATYSGDYVFTFNSNTKKLTVTYPTRSLTVNAKLNTSNTILGSISNTSTTSSFFTITDNHNDTFTVTPKSHTAYQFTKWRDNNSTTGSRTITVTTTAAITYDTNWNYKSYTITYNTNGGALAAGSFDTVTTANQVYTGSYTYGTEKTLPTSSDISHSTSGYTFAGWYTSSDFSGSPVDSIGSSESGNKTYWAKWEMQIEFRDNIRSAANDANLIETQTVPVGGNAEEPDLTDADDVLEPLGFTFSSYSVDPTTTTFNADWVSNNGSNIIYVIYAPVAQNFSISIVTSGNITGSGETNSDPYIIGYGAKISVHAEISEPQGASSGISYKWLAYVDDHYIDGEYLGGSDDDEDTYDSSTNRVTFDRDDIVSLLANTSPNGKYTLKAMAYYTGTTGEVVSATAATKDMYYRINSPLSDPVFKRGNDVFNQKIYSTDMLPTLVANITTDGTITTAENDNGDDYDDILTQRYKTALVFFDKTTKTYIEDNTYLSITGTAPNFTSTFSGLTTGVNYYRFKIKRLSNIDNLSSELVDDVDTVTATARSVVGTAQGSAARPIYIANNSGNTFNGKRVMLFYSTDRGDLGFATGYAFNHATAAGGNADKEVYRFEIPDYVESVSIGVFDTSKEYVLPTMSGGSIDYTGTNFYTWSDRIPISASTQKLNISGVTANGQTATANITAALLS